MRNGHNGSYVSQAKRFLAAAEREFVVGKQSQDDTTIRQAAEKAWGAVVQATNALLQRHREKPGVGTGRKQDALVRLEVRFPPVRRLRFADRYSAALLALHARCFYDGDYSLDVVEREIRRTGEYISDVARL